MRRAISLFLLIIAFSGIINAQQELKFEFDFARFNYDSTSVYLEFYYDLNPANMILTETANGKIIEAIVHIEMKNIETNEFVINKEWKIQNLITDEAGNNLMGVVGFIIPVGKYSLSVSAFDSKNTLVKKTFNETVIVDKLKSNKYSISDIELASSIKKDDVDEKSIFYKNGLEVIPNPAMVYSNNAPVLFYYAELYNLKLKDPKTDFTLQKHIYNSAGTPVYKMSKSVKQISEAVVEYGIVNLAKMPSDSYNLVFSLIDQATNEAFVSSKRFYHYNPNVKDTSSVKRINSSVINSEFSVLNSEDCDKLFSQAKYIAAKTEVEQYKSLDSLGAKREFLFNFWAKRDFEPSTPINEFKNEYLRRVEIANRNYSSLYKEGYLTDRGRVLLLFGEPDQKDFFPSESEYKPYEIWFYNEIEGGATFVFGDPTGFGNFELLHSTKRGEIKDENWKRRLSSQR